MLRKFLEKLLKQPQAAPADDLKPAQDSRAARASRIETNALNAVEFQFADGAYGGLALEVLNISTSGIGFKPLAGKPALEKGASYSGFLTLKRIRIPVCFRIAFVSPAAVGCAFTGDTVDLKVKLADYFLLELAAESLTELNAKMLKEEPDGMPRLFRGKTGCEMFLVEKDGELLRFEMTFFGCFIAAGKGLKTKMGYLSSSSEGKAQYGSAAVVRMVAEIPNETIEAATKFLSHVPGLSDKQRADVRAMLSPS